MHKVLRQRMIVFGAAFGAALLCGAPAKAETAHVAVAANFTEAAKALKAAFEAESAHNVLLSFGSTGQLYAQITQGAPYELFLAADAERPARAVAEGLAVEGSVFTYAVGRLALWSRDPALASEAGLRGGGYGALAIANPRTAPYGAAALEVMDALGALEAARPKLVNGNNVAQAFQFAHAGAAELAFVAYAQVIGREDGAFWLAPADLHAPIRQDAALLEAGRGDPAAAAFLAYLASDAAGAVIARFGYERGDD